MTTKRHCLPVTNPYSRRTFVSTMVSAAGFLCCSTFTAQGAARTSVTDHLSGNTVLIIRHAEKPESGIGLTPDGERRAQAYATYFEPFHEGRERFHVDALYSGMDSKNSTRPRLTLEPLSRAANLPLDLTIGTSNSESMVTLLRTAPHGRHPLICWRHGHIPQLLRAFGADPANLLPDGKWPDDVFDWVLVLHFDDAGQLTSSERVVEHITIP